MAKWGRSHQILSKKFLFLLKVSKPSPYFKLFFHLPNLKKDFAIRFKDGKHSEAKARPKLMEAVFNKEVSGKKWGK